MGNPNLKDLVTELSLPSYRTLRTFLSCKDPRYHPVKTLPSDTIVTEPLFPIIDRRLLNLY